MFLRDIELVVTIDTSITINSKCVHRVVSPKLVDDRLDTTVMKFETDMS